MAATWQCLPQDRPRLRLPKALAALCRGLDPAHVCICLKHYPAVLFVETVVSPSDRPTQAASSSPFLDGARESGQPHSLPVWVQVSEEVLEWTVSNVYKENDEVGEQPPDAGRRGMRPTGPAQMQPATYTISSPRSPPLCQIHLLHIIPVPMPEVRSGAGRDPACKQRWASFSAPRVGWLEPAQPAMEPCHEPSFIPQLAALDGAPKMRPCCTVVAAMHAGSQRPAFGTPRECR